jgi:Xaa-Pro aminopeptidase
MRHALTPVSLLLLALLAPAPARAQRASYPAEEFAARRKALAAALGEGTVLLFAASRPKPAARFRQDHDFWYLTGNEDLNAALVMDVRSGRAHLFLPAQNERSVRMDDANWLTRPALAEGRGFASILPLTELEEFLARGRSGRPVLWARLSERDEVDGGRRDTAVANALRQSTSYGAQPSEDAWRAALLRDRCPACELRDVTPALDALRVIKSPLEIELLRRNGRLSAEGVRRAMEITRAGRYEYELAAAATHAVLEGGAESVAYAPVVGSGPNVNVWHYDRSDRRLEDGDLVVMDFGASLGYLTMDITRTFPVSGRFSARQAKAYAAVLEAQKAIIAAMKPGVTRAQTREICREVFARHGFADQQPAGAGHFVGLAVHDVGDREAPLAAGMVIAVEPIIDIPSEQLHIRVEDTVLVTAQGAEILSVGLPKEAAEVEALTGSRGR